MLLLEGTVPAIPIDLCFLTRKSHRPFNSSINDQQEPTASKSQVYELMRVYTDRGWSREGEKCGGQSAKAKTNEVWEGEKEKKQRVENHKSR